MSLTNTKNKSQGFTIVELLIVVVVIAILAAITIVAYNGITQRANTSSAQSTAANFAKKIEAYNADQGSYPANGAALTSAAASNTYAVTGVTINNNSGSPVALTAAPSSPSTIALFLCGTNTSAAATNLATVTVRTGYRVDFWNYQTGASSSAASGTDPKSPTAGQTSGTAPNTYNVTCYPSL
ncbi:MAG: prepilin-type N-terminal cleavage/methylation domain-containing protein [Candidatus Microsaccharimonas sp.]